MSRKTQPERKGCGAPGCQADAADGSELCREHQRRFHARLAEVPAVLSDLALTISRQDRMVEHSGKAAETPLPWNERAAMVDAELRRVLGALARDTYARHADERDPLAHAFREGFAEVARWVIRNRHTLFELPGVGEHFSALDLHVGRARQVTDRPSVKARFLVGPCPEAQSEGAAYPGRPCPGEAWAVVPEDELDPAWIKCLECSASWGTVQWRRLARRIAARKAEIEAEWGYPDERG